MDAALPSTAATTDHRLAAARHAFSTPERVPLTTEERQLLADAAEPALRHEGLKLVRWTLGTGPRVLLVHGWNSRGAHLLGIAQALVRAGFSATLFDLPAHGDSGGQTASVVHAARALQAMAAEIGGLHGVIGHSMGSAAALLAFSEGLRVERSVHLAGPSSLTPVIKGLAAVHGLTPGDAAAFAGWAASFIGTALGNVDLERLRGGLRHTGLILHDSQDRTVPFAASAALHAAWPDSTLVATTDLGHRRLLGDATVIAQTAAFMAGGA